MTKEQIKAYIEILDNLKRDLSEDEGEEQKQVIRAEVAKEIGERLSTFKAGIFMPGGDELIVIPQSSLEFILKTYKPPIAPTCTKCKNFIACSLEKQIFFEFEEAK